MKQYPKKRKMHIREIASVLHLIYRTSIMVISPDDIAFVALVLNQVNSSQINRIRCDLYVNVYLMLILMSSIV